ncbi:hypothetical protein CDL12_10999 [Handroanthus impetiginosus]|uniref:Transmembrane protein n=1 Tax=Handroanthus impetiginosus TaxID=429701 RepID=A0A2G9HFM9_9LAMI|nr:hypothetical protein CDL12_10999 [Handroanthus impetiginosus]
MSSKGIVVFGIFLAMVLLSSSEVVARALVETSNTINTSKEDIGYDDVNGHADSCIYGCCCDNPKFF